MVDGIENWLYYDTDNCLHQLCIELFYLRPVERRDPTCSVTYSGCLKLGVKQTAWRKIFRNEYNNSQIKHFKRPTVVILQSNLALLSQILFHFFSIQTKALFPTQLSQSYFCRSFFSFLLFFTFIQHLTGSCGFFLALSEATQALNEENSGTNQLRPVSHV